MSGEGNRAYIRIAAARTTDHFTDKRRTSALYRHRGLLVITHPRHTFDRLPLYRPGCEHAPNLNYRAKKPSDETLREVLAAERVTDVFELST